MGRLNLKPLDRQVVVITGASSGIGLATARHFARAGARVMLVARNEQALKAIAREIEANGGQAVAVAGDVRDRADMEHAADVAIRTFGRIDTWVNDAGTGVYARLEEIEERDHRAVFETNYWGVVNGTLSALARMRKKGGAIINIGSIASDMASPLLSSYAATKHAVKGFTNSLRMELIHDRVPVSLTLIKPSGMNTPFGEHARNYMDVASKVPPPVYDPALVADAVVYAAANPTREITVGGVGKAMVLLSALAPMLADRLYAQSFFKLGRDPSRAPARADGLDRAGPRPGRVMGEQKLDRRTSVWTAVQTHPRLSLGLGLAAVAALAAGRGAAAKVANAPS